MPSTKVFTRKERRSISGLWARLHARNSLLADAGALFSNSLTTSGIGFLFWVAAARWYREESVGFASAAISMMYLLGNISRLGLDIALARVLPRESRPGQRVGMITATLLVVATGAMLAALIFVVQPFFGREASAVLRRSPPATLLFVLACAGWGVGLVLDQILLVTKNGQYVLWRNTVISLVKLLALVPLLFVVDESYGIFAAQAAGVAAGFFVIWPLARPSIRRVAGLTRSGFTELRPSLVRFALGNHVSALIAGVPGWLLPLILVSRVGAKETAFFYTTWMIQVVMNQAPSALGSGFFAEGARRGQASGGLLRSVYGYAILFMVPVVVVVVVGAPWILRIFGANYAAAGTPLLRVLALGTIPNTLVIIEFMRLRLEGHLLVLGIASLVYAVITLAGSYILLPRLGLPGVGLAWAAANTCELAVCLAQRYQGRARGTSKEPA